MAQVHLVLSGIKGVSCDGLGNAYFISGKVLDRSPLELMTNKKQEQV